LEHALAGLRRLAAGVEVSYAAGFSIDDEADDPALVAEAVAAATAAERVVLFLGLPARYESEGFDRTDLDLPANQLNLLRAIVDTGRDVVVVLANGGVVSLEPWHDSVAAIVEGWLGGQAGGGAIADVLFGVVNPSGKLAETIPFALADTPSHVNFPGERGKVRYGEGVFIGYRWYDMLGRDVRYPFGHGLSYTTFSYRDLVVRAVNADAGQVEVRCTVTNTGAVAGSEVVQLYVGDPESTVRRPVRELKAFAKVSLDPGASETVVLTLAGRDFSFYDVRLGGWKREGGVFILEVGASSRDIRLSGAIELPDDGATVPLDHGSTLGEWLAHPVGGDLLRSRVFASLNGDAESLSAEIMQMLASMPLTRFSRFPGVDLTAAALTALLAEANA
jgi:beta-glucosidase